MYINIHKCNMCFYKGHYHDQSMSDYWLVHFRLSLISSHHVDEANIPCVFASKNSVDSARQSMVDRPTLRLKTNTARDFCGSRPLCVLHKSR